MSIKSTIVAGDSFHLYHEFDGAIYLDLDNPDTACIEQQGKNLHVTVRLPKELIDRLKVDDEQLEETDFDFDPGRLADLLKNSKK